MEGVDRVLVLNTQELFAIGLKSTKEAINYYGGLIIYIAFK